jgi:hypothetical protein
MMYASESSTQDVTVTPLEDLTEISSSPQSLELATLLPFDTIIVRTANSEYRIVLLDPVTGRALLEGGRQLSGPIEVMVLGSSLGDMLPRVGWIGVGFRMEACANDGYIRTSPVQSLSVEHQPSPLNFIRILNDEQEGTNTEDDLAADLRG